MYLSTVIRIILTSIFVFRSLLVHKYLHFSVGICADNIALASPWSLCSLITNPWSLNWSLVPGSPVSGPCVYWSLFPGFTVGPWVHWSVVPALIHGPCSLVTGPWSLVTGPCFHGPWSGPWVHCKSYSREGQMYSNKIKIPMLAKIIPVRAKISFSINKPLKSIVLSIAIDYLSQCPAIFWTGRSLIMPEKLTEPSLFCSWLLASSTVFSLQLTTNYLH